MGKPIQIYRSMNYDEFVRKLDYAVNCGHTDTFRLCAILFVTQDFNVKQLLANSTSDYLNLWRRADYFTYMLHNNLGLEYDSGLPY